MSVERKFKRNVIRNKFGNRAMQDLWAGYQNQRYGEDYEKVCRPKGKKKRRNN